MQQLELVGGCLCGDVRYQAAGEVTSLCYCHCQSCRRAVGAPMVPWGTVARDQFVVTRGQLVEHPSSPAVMRGHCARCGTSLTYRHNDRVTEIDIALASLDKPELFAPEVHIWVRDKLSWVKIADGLPQYVTVKPES